MGVRRRGGSWRRRLWGQDKAQRVLKFCLCVLQTGQERCQSRRYDRLGGIVPITQSSMHLQSHVCYLQSLELCIFLFFFFHSFKLIVLLRHHYFLVQSILKVLLLHLCLRKTVSFWFPCINVGNVFMSRHLWLISKLPFTALEPWCQVHVGRMDVLKLLNISSGRYFGFFSPHLIFLSFWR